MSDEFSFDDEQPAIEDGRTPLALALGLAAALAAGGMWALLVLITNVEIGYAAIGIGFLVGIAMSRATAQRTSQLAYAAAMLARRTHRRQSVHLRGKLGRGCGGCARR
jgi:hypothetical protein